MARTPDNFSLNNQISTTAEALNADVAASSQAIIRKLSFYNSSSSTRTVTVYVVEASGTADTGNTLVKKAIPPLKSWNCTEVQGEVLEAGMTIQASQDSGTDVNTNMSGSTVT